jgi:mannosyltransferase
MATVEKPRTFPSLLQSPPIRDFGAPGWFERLPRWLSTGGVLVILLAISAVIRARYLNGQLWSDEANTIGIASHSLGSIPGILRQGGGAPLYFFLLHFWMSAFGSGEVATHSMSMMFGLASVPVGMWAGWSLFGRRAGFMLAALMAFNSFLTEYADESRMYELMALLGLIAVAAFLHAFLYRRRRYVAVFSGSLLLMLYTDAWGIFFCAAAAVALIPIYRRSDDRHGIVRDALMAFGAAAVLYLPWLPTLIHQAGNATDPWHYAPVPGANVPRNLLGTDRVDALLAIVAVAGVLPLVFGPGRRSPEAGAMWALIAIPVVALILTKLATVIAPDWDSRYFAPLVAAFLVFAALMAARTGILGLFAIVVCCAFLANAKSFVPQYKSDMRDVSAEVSGYLHPGDVVLVAQPEQAPLAYYYLGAGLRFATSLGPDSHPTYMDWDGAMGRLQNTSPAATLSSLVATMRPGQHLLFIRPLSEGIASWHQPWTELVRLRSAQLGYLLARDPGLALLHGVWAPHYYRGSCCVASSALIYTVR